MARLFYKIRWHLFRSPISPFIKFIKRLLISSEIERRKSYLNELPLGEKGKSVLSELRSNGYAVVTDLMDEQKLKDIAALGLGKVDRLRAGALTHDSTHKNFWVRLLDEDKQNGAFSTDNPFVKIAIENNLLSLVSHYFEELPQLDYVLLTLSQYAEGDHKVSQLWHRDHDDTKVVKFFIYLTDVLGKH